MMKSEKASLFFIEKINYLHYVDCNLHTVGVYYLLC